MSWKKKEPIGYGRFSNGVYYPKSRDAGFFSLCSTSLLDLSQIRQSVNQVKSRGLFKDYVTRRKYSRDAWSIFFQQPITGIKLPEDREPYRGLHHHAIYREVNVGRYTPFIQKYFSPSARVLETREGLVQKYNLDLNMTVAINIRGTDKYTEIQSPSLTDYLDLAAKSLSMDSRKRILLVTDQRQYLDLFEREFKSSVVSFGELPTTLGDLVIHKQLKRVEREEFGVNFLSTVLIMAQASEVITHTGNGALWTALFRQGTGAFTQLRGKEILRSLD